MEKMLCLRILHRKIHQIWNSYIEARTTYLYLEFYRHTVHISRFEIPIHMVNCMAIFFYSNNKAALTWWILLTSELVETFWNFHEVLFLAITQSHLGFFKDANITPLNLRCSQHKQKPRNNFIFKRWRRCLFYTQSGSLVYTEGLN